MSGFVYIWFDKKHKRFYLGSHWGDENDGYICSSSWMKQAYKSRPKDFRRKIIKRISTSRIELLLEEDRWLKMIKPSEMGKRYYNKVLFAKAPPPRTGCEPWNKGKTLTAEHKAKVATGTKEAMAALSEETKQNVKQTQFKKGSVPWNKDNPGVMPPAWNKGKAGCFSEETRKKMSEAKIGRVPWNKGRKGIPNNIKYTPELRQKMSEQARAKAARLPKLFHNNEWKTLADWCRFYEISRYSVHRRLKRGWSLDKALNTPCPKIRKIQSRM